MYKKLILLFFILAFLFSSCFTTVPNGGNSSSDFASEENLASLTFINNSHFKVKIYKDINPSDDSSQPIFELDAGTQETKELPPSRDPSVGNVFYIRYFVQILDAQESETQKPFYAKAKRTIANIKVVLQSGKAETREIEQPPKGSLTFANAYIRVQNNSSYAIEVLNGDSILTSVDSERISLESEKKGVYKIKMPWFEDSKIMNNFKFFNSSLNKSYEVKKFELKQAHIYNFTIDNNGVVGSYVVEKIEY